MSLEGQAMSFKMRLWPVLIGGGLLVAAAPVERSQLVSADIESAMIQEAYASLVNARAAQSTNAAGHRQLGALLEQMAATNRARFEYHNQILPAESLEDRLTQVFATLLALEVQYGEAAIESREAGDGAMAEHFDKLAGEVRFERHRFEVEVERTFGGKRL
ncbi:hypothetical protein HY78_07730 [Rhizorhabdus wittichii DC-6]|nr:hypothetical protein HY78_07730 [Rhizorhabdus wittichii DC-6]